MESVLVANRGEIARRVFRTCRAMGIRAVAVFSDPDRAAPFVAEADEAIALGGESAADTYLRADRIIEAARRTNVDAIHPGYGFLAENAEFARAAKAAGLLWIGPSADVIARMGSKLASKQLVADVGVPTLPSVDLTGLTGDALESAVAGIGFPVLIKASAGGGGIGMRRVERPDDLEGALAGGRREAENAFGDGTIFAERLLVTPRHIEVQVFGDSHGNVVAMGERECSIQRRHQKIIEECPSPAVDTDLRSRMSADAVAIARAIGYEGAGTVEFLLDGDESYFLEMNTRLQVEHPVTEAVTGLDLVRLQLLVASGEPLPPEALTPPLNGHAIEARLYAEDATRDFLPVGGRLTRFSIETTPGIRVDSGVESGSDVPAFYDPLLAKVIAHAPTRREAALALAATLHRSRIHGCVTNRDLLVNVLRHPEFLSGATDTAFLGRASSLAASTVSAEDAREMALAAVLSDHDARRAEAPVLSTLPSGWRNNPSSAQSVAFDGPGGAVVVNYAFRRDGRHVAFDDADDPLAFSYTVDGEAVTVEIAGRRRTYRVARTDEVFDVDGPTGHIRLVRRARFPSPAGVADGGSLRAPLPGTVVAVTVELGAAVTIGDELLVMEAMKMEHTLRAPFTGIVEAIRAAVGDQVEAGADLIVVREENET